MGLVGVNTRMKKMNEFAGPAPAPAAPAAPTQDQMKFSSLVKAWDGIRRNRIDDLMKIAPDLTTLDHVRLKCLADQGSSMSVQFSGLDTAVNNTSNIPQVKMLIRDWLGRISTSVKIAPSPTPNTMVLQISKDSNILETIKPKPVKLNAPRLREHKYEQDLGVDRVKIIKV